MLQKVTTQQMFQAGLFDFSIGAISSFNSTVLVLIIKIEYILNGSRQADYLICHHPPSVLDLSHLACQTVSVSVALVNQDGDVRFSNSTTQCVHGGESMHEAKYITCVRGVNLITFNKSHVCT